jgi:hemerythrin superfamily protein
VQEGLCDFYKESNWSLLHTVLQRIAEEKKTKHKGAEGQTEGQEIYKVLEDHAQKERTEDRLTPSRLRTDTGEMQTVEENDVQKAVDLIMQIEEERQANDEKMRTDYEHSYLAALPDPTSFDDLDDILFSECQRWSLNAGKLSER